MKETGFWGVFDKLFDTPLFDVLLVINAMLLLLVFNSEWPTMYTPGKPLEHVQAFNRHHDRIIDEFVRPKIEEQYNVKTFRAKTNPTKASGVYILIETDGTGRYEEIAEDVLRLAPVLQTRIDVSWPRVPDIGDDGEPNDPPLAEEKRPQLKYILEFDHGSDDGGFTVFFANGHRYPKWSTPWHSNDLYNFH